MTYREAKYEVAEQLKKAGIENELAESWFLMEFACDIDRNFYLLHQTEKMPGEAYRAFLEVAKKRCAHMPLQYLTGVQEFMGLPFHVNEHVLIPRQDTEVLVETALGILKREMFPSRSSDSAQNQFPCGQNGEKRNDGLCRQIQGAGRHFPLKVLDLCTGSGCIAISLKAFLPEISVTASDVSAEALAVARGNAKELRLAQTKNMAQCAVTDDVGEPSGIEGMIHFLQSDLFAAISGRFDMIVSNPPYIRSDVLPALMPEVREHEPLLALDGSADGLYFYRKIIAESPRYLNDGGWLLFEIGAEQGEAVSALLREQGFCDIEVIPDLAGLDRVVKSHL